MRTTPKARWVRVTGKWAWGNHHEYVFTSESHRDIREQYEDLHQHSGQYRSVAICNVKVPPAGEWVILAQRHRDNIRHCEQQIKESQMALHTMGCHQP
jgi:hypothetical protein